MAANEELDFIRGTLDLLVLKTLTWGPRHGYAIARWIKQQSRESLLLEDRALYLALHRLEARDWVESEWGVSENNRRAKYYQLTPSGRRQLRAKVAHWTNYAEVVFTIIGAKEIPPP